jgi:hypothetical protein
MCDPFTLAAAGIGAAGSLVSAQAASGAAKYQAQVDEMNARIEEKRSVDAIERGQQAEQLKRREVSQFQSQQVASMSAAGLDVAFGSPLQQAVDTATLGEMDAMQIRENAEQEAYDFKVGAANYRASAGANRAAAHNAMIGGVFDAAGTLIGGAGSAWKSSGGKWGGGGGGAGAGSQAATAVTPASVGGAGTSSPVPGYDPLSSIRQAPTPRRNPFKRGNRYVYSMGH